MDSQKFKEFGYAAIDYVANYIDTIRDRSVLPDVQPGYLNDKIPPTAPEHGEPWQDLMKDYHELIMPGVTHWQSPQFHAFFPSGSSFPSVIGEIFSAALGVIGLHWEASPSCTELEVKVMNWLGELIHLPEQFLNNSLGPGGGIIQGSASESTFLCMLVAKSKSLRQLKKLHPEMTEGDIHGKLVAYSSDQANSSVEKAGLLGSMIMRLLPADENGMLHKETVIESIQNDRNQGLFPCFMVVTLGTTGLCVYDELSVFGPICEKYNIWMHVDAAYAGAALVLPEYRHLIKGIEYAESFNFNPHKWLLVNSDCSALWVKDATELTRAMTVNPLYLKDTKNIDTQLPEYRNWQIPLSRRFRALKVWFTLRTYGKSGLQAHIRNHLKLALLFQSFVEQDSRFEITSPTRMGLVCFRLKGENKLSEELHARLMSRRNLYMIAATIHGKYILRFVVCSRLTTESDIYYAWNEITSQADIVLAERNSMKDRTTTQYNLNGSGQLV